MKNTLLLSFLFVSALLNAQERYDVASEMEFDMAHDLASAGDSIVWESGTYYNTHIEIDKDGLIVTAQPYGTALFTGASRATIDADDITFSGFQYIGGLIGNLNVINIEGSDVLITHVNIQDYTSYKYLVVDENCRRNTISYCNFENRLNLDDKNILSILVDNEPGFHKIQYCSFKNFDGIGNDMGIEPIRIGVSSQGHLESRTLVEYCYFTHCDGDGEIISHKSRQNVYRYNTFENNTKAELTLRHGHESIVYGNFFLHNMGGIRVREGSRHYIYNNYFEGMDRRSIYLQNDPSDPLDDVHIYHNTIVNSAEVILGGDGNNPPTNVFIANNVFASPTEDLFEEETGSETWMANLSFGELGIDPPSSGLSETDPVLIENTEGYVQPDVNSPLIAAEALGYPSIPLYEGMDYDNEILLDLMKETRPANRTIGASEFSTTVNVQPHVTEATTGPLYLFDNLVDYLAVNAIQFNLGNQMETKSLVVSSNIDWTVSSTVDWLSVDMLSGFGDDQITLTIEANPETEVRSGTLTFSGGNQVVTVDVSQNAGFLLNTPTIQESALVLYPNPARSTLKLNGWEAYHTLTVYDQSGKVLFQRKPNLSGVLDVSDLRSGIYIIALQADRKRNLVKFVKY